MRACLCDERVTIDSREDGLTTDALCISAQMTHSMCYAAFIGTFTSSRNTLRAVCTSTAEHGAQRHDFDLSRCLALGDCGVQRPTPRRP